LNNCSGTLWVLFRTFWFFICKVWVFTSLFLPSRKTVNGMPTLCYLFLARLLPQTFAPHTNFAFHRLFWPLSYAPRAIRGWLDSNQRSPALGLKFGFNCCRRS